MPHLVRPFRDESLQGAVRRLHSVHAHLTNCAGRATPPPGAENWGSRFKRVRVILDTPERPPDIEKTDEALSEVINMTATLERLIAVLEWFTRDRKFAGSRVSECHPSTSDSEDGNDLVLTDHGGNVIARVEVCDVVSSSSDGNSKEPSSLNKLGCQTHVPSDGVARFLVTSPEFGSYIGNDKRKWRRKHYRYESHLAGDHANTVILAICNQTPSPSLQRAPSG
jgi:hypothetical protein